MNANAVKSSGQEIELQALRDALQTRLDELLPPGQERDLVCAAMREGALTPGKRVRPLLTHSCRSAISAATPASLR